jgi:sugar lactone lactonase YvrE
MKRTVVGLVAVLMVVAAGCSSGGSDAGTEGGKNGAATSPEPLGTSTTTAAPEPLKDQTAPTSINGITVQGDTIWVASIKDDEILQVDRTSGAILQRFDTEGAGPDDVAVAPDGSIWSTGFVNGEVGRIADGRYEEITTLVPGINPITVDADGIVWIGTYGPKGNLYRLDPDDLPSEGTTPKPIASGTLPDINAFGILDNGTLVAPAGGIAGPGSAIAINSDTGRFTTIVGGLPGVAAATVDADDHAYLLANTTGEVIAVDVDAKTSKVVQTVTQGAPFDNLDVAADGTFYLSSFVAPTVTEVQSDGTEHLITLGG